MALGVRDSQIAGLGRAGDPLHGIPPRRRGSPHREPGVQHGWPALCGGHLHRDPAPAVRRVREDTARAAGVSRSPAISNGPPERPYDVTANTLPLLFGLTATPIAEEPARLQLSAPIATPHVTPVAAGFGATEAPKVAIYRSYAASMDEGWTRWIFDTWKVPYVSIVDSTMRAGGLKAKFDVIILPDESPHDLLEGLPSPRYPAPYAGGLGSSGVDALRQFVQDGGTLVALNESSRFLIQTLLLPVRNILEGVGDDEFYAPGSIFRLELDTTAAEARGMPPRSIAWYEGGPAFDVLDSSQVRVIGRYPADPNALLLSGWVLHPDRVAGRAALVEVKVGQGKAILFGFRPQYRGQSLATYPLLFNSLGVK